MKMLMIVLVSMSWLGTAGCSSPPPPQQPSQRQVQSDSDRFFDKMKQEERDHGKQENKSFGGGY